jgi:uncharacterized protein (TIGR02611 family)
VTIIKALRKTGIFLAGFIVIIIGIILLPLPGPGILVIIAGLAILAIEFEWARRHHQRIKDLAKKSLQKLKGR